MTMSSSAESAVSSKANAAQSFVINLCSSTSPMALAHPSSPELKRYTFFVSRQREDGRERFRLHMGYFVSQVEAEQLLAAVRDVYPAAWAGPAPTSGVARRGRISPVQLAPAVAQAASSAAATKSTAPVMVQDTIKVAVPAAAVATPPAAPADAERPLEQTMSEMRTVLAHLGNETTQIQKLPTPPAVQPATPAAPPAARPVIDPPRLQPVMPKVAASRAAPAAELTPAQTLKVLEAPARAVPAAPVARAVPATPDLAPLRSPFEGLENEPVVRVVTPEDTQTLVDIKLDRDNNAPPCFAVQLYWSVSPIEVADLPHMAIFDAYTLYHVEGNRQGRKWYGLRLGFFTDPNSATQVANYVRGDYRAVAVVPVANKERERATGVTTPSPLDSGINPPLRAADQLSTNREAMDGFELVTDDRPTPQKRDLDMPRAAKDPQAAAAAAVRAKLDKVLNPNGATAEPGRGSVVKPTSKAGGKRVVVRKRPDAMHLGGAPGTAAVLESTLDILGASTLTLDEGKGQNLEATSGGKRPPVKKNGKFSKLLSRLSGG
jgi:hypothetical protein